MEGKEPTVLVRLALSAVNGWWIWSVGIGVSHLKIKQQVWFDKLQVFRSAVIGWYMVEVPCGNRSFTYVKNPNRFERMDSM